MKWPVYLVAALIAEAVAIPMAFIIPATNWRPPYFTTPDNSIDGDLGHLERTLGWPVYLRRVWWLLRNRAYGFKLYAIGCPMVMFRTHGDPSIQNRNNAVAGWFLLQSHSGYWYFKTINPIGSNYCIQLALGWQLNAPIYGRCLFMFSPRITRFYAR